MDDINWKAANPRNAAYVIEQYEKQLAASRELYSVLEDKARWVLTVTIPLGSVIATYLFTSETPDWPPQLAAWTLAGGLLLSALFAGLAIWPREYAVGARIPDDIREWRPLIEGAEKEAGLFAKMRIETISAALQLNENSNKAKGWQVKRAILVGGLAAPVAFLIFVAARVLLLCAVTPGVGPAFVAP